MVNPLSSSSVSWSKIGLIAYADNKSTDSNLCISFLETVNGLNWRFHEPRRYRIYPNLYDAQHHTASAATNSSNQSSQNTTMNHHSSTNTIGTPNLTSSNKPYSSIPCHFFYNINSVYWNNWFNLPGDMLAICDELGNMTMLIIGQSPKGPATIDKLTILFQDNIYKFHNQLMTLDPITERSAANSTEKVERKETKKQYQTAILDFFWFCSSKPIIFSQFCLMENETQTFKNKVQQIKPFGVFYPPSMKYGCMSIRINGQIDFWYQFSNSKTHKKISTYLRRYQNKESDELDWLEFAKISPMSEDQCCLITTYSKISNNLTFYKLFVDWNINSNNSNILNNPTLKITQLLQTTLDKVDTNGDPIELTNIHVLSKPFLDKAQQHPEIVLIFKNLKKSTSMIERFKLIKTSIAINFLKIFNPNLNLQQLNINQQNNTTDSLRYSLNHIKNMNFDKLIVSVSSENLDEFITFYFSDGTLDTYNQSDWILENLKLENQVKTSKYRNMLTSVLSTGFNYPKTFNSFSMDWFVVSPSMTGVIAKLKNKSTPTYFALEYNVNDASNDLLTSTAYAFAFVSNTHRQLSSEDLSISCKTHLTRINEIDPKRACEYLTSLMTSIYSFFNMTPDAPKDILDKMISSRPIQKTILLQLELGNGLENQNIYQMARITMSLRNVLFAFNGVARNLQFAIEQLNSNNISHSSGKLFQAIFTKQDLIYSLIPIAKWFVKFVTYLMQGALIMINNPMDKSNSLALGVFGAKIPRTIMISILSEMNKVVQLITKYPETTFPILNESSTFLRMIVMESPVNLNILEKLLVNINVSLPKFTEKKPYFTKSPRLLVTADVKEEDTDFKEYLLTSIKNMFFADANTSSIFFTDTQNLRITNDVFFKDELLHLLQPVSKGLVIDEKLLPSKYQNSKSISNLTFDSISFEEFTKEEIATEKVKRCCRCGSITRAGYNILPNRTVVPTSIPTRRWPTMYSRVCLCSGYLFELDESQPTTAS